MSEYEPDPYYAEGDEDLYAGEPVQLDDVIAEAVDQAVSEKLGPLEEYVRPEQQAEWIDEAEARWAEEDAALAEEERQEQVVDAAEEEAIQLVAKHAHKAGITSGEDLSGVWHLANRLMDDSEFERTLEGPKRVEAAIRHAVEAHTPAADETTAARRFMTRHKAPSTDSGASAALELAAPIMGLTKQEKAEAKRAFGLE